MKKFLGIFIFLGVVGLPFAAGIQVFTRADKPVTQGIAGQRHVGATSSKDERRNSAVVPAKSPRDLIASGPGTPAEPPGGEQPCDCGCYSLFTVAWLACSVAAGPCCQSDAPQGGGDRGPINAELRIIRWNDGPDVEHLFTKKCSRIAPLTQKPLKS